MITALQNLISGKMGKVFFTLLLLIIVVSFVLYLSQGNSVFDHLGESGRKRDFYGHDLNDVDVNRYLSAAHGAATEVGAVVVPGPEALQAASARFHPEVPQRIQANLMAQYGELVSQMGAMPPKERQNFDQFFRRRFEQVQGLMNNWNFLPDPIRARIISQEHPEDKEFQEASVKAKLALENLADRWELLPPEADGPAVDAPFLRHLGQINPSLALNDGNRSEIFSEIGKNHGLPAGEVEDIVFSYYRTAQVDEILVAAGFAFAEEAELDLLTENLAWTADGVSLSADDIELPAETFATITFKDQPKPNDKLSMRLPGRMLEVEFLASPVENNSSSLQVVIGPAGKLAVTRDNLRSALQKADPGFLLVPEGNATLALQFDEDNLPPLLPVLATPSSALEIVAGLEARLRAYHEERKNEAPFQEPAGSVLTAVTFAMNQRLETPEEPSEDRLRRYFETNKADFATPTPPPPPLPTPESNASPDGQPGPEGENGPKGDSNVTASEANATQNVADVLAELEVATGSESNATPPPTPSVTFELVRAEVRERVMQEDRDALEAEAWDLAQDDAKAFLVELQKASSRLRRKHTDHHALRNSDDVKALIAKHGATTRPISFSAKNLATQSALFGFSNLGGRSPLQEAAKLNESNFFSGFLSRARDGYVVFLYDGSTNAEPGQYAKTEFNLLYREYRSHARSQAFKQSADELAALLEETEDLPADRLHPQALTVSIVEKSSSTLYGAYQKRSGKLDASRNKLTEERDQIVQSEVNATAEQAAAYATRKAEIDEEIETLRKQNAELSAERALAERIFRETFETGTQSGWKELERTDSSITYLNVRKALLNISRPDQEAIEERLENLSIRRVDEARGGLVRDLVKAGEKQPED